jgi:hypothetical protein
VNRKLLVESVELAKAGTSGVLMGDAVKEAGLDPALFLAVVPGECGVAGRANGNNRIYVPEEVANEHARLCDEARSRFVDGERDHPDAGPTWDVVTRLVDGSVAVLKDGSIKTSARFAILNTTIGRDLLVCWQAGVPVGVSSRGYGRVVEHVLDEKSPYAKMNPDRAGERVSLIQEYELEGYDWVRTPSAGTFIEPPQREVGEALRKVREAAENQERKIMDPKTVAELAEKFPALVAEIRGESKPVVEECSALREKFRVAEATVAGQAEKIVELNATVETMRAEKNRAETRVAVESAVRAFVVGRPGGAKVCEMVLADFDGGSVKNVDEANANAKRYVELVEAAKVLPVDPSKVVESTDPNGSKPTTSSAATRLSEI